MSKNSVFTHTFSADGNSNEFRFAEGPRLGTPGGIGTFAAWKSFGGGTVKMQVSPDGGTTWIDADSAELEFTANGIGNFHISGGLEWRFRINLSGSTTPDLEVKVTGGQIEDLGA